MARSKEADEGTVTAEPERAVVDEPGTVTRWDAVKTSLGTVEIVYEVDAEGTGRVTVLVVPFEGAQAFHEDVELLRLRAT